MLKHGDLKGTILPLISVDEYEAKSGTSDEIIVVGFYTIDEDPAKDLDDFIEKSFATVLDVDVSPNPDEEGRYMVFVEFKRAPDFMLKLLEVVEDVENVSGKMKWKVTAGNLDSEVFLSDPALKDSLMLENPVGEFFESAGITGLRFTDTNILVEDYNGSVSMSFVDFGDSSVVLEKCGLKHSPVNLMSSSYNVRKLRGILGRGWHVSELNEHVAIQNEWSNNMLVVRL